MYSVEGRLHEIYDTNQRVWGELSWPTQDSTGANPLHQSNDEQEFFRGKIYDKTGFIKDEVHTNRGCPSEYVHREDPNTDIYKDILHTKERNTFSDIERADGNNGQLHQWCNSKVIDYDYIKFHNRETHNYSLMFIKNNKASLLYGSFLDVFFENGDCTTLGVPLNDGQRAATSPQGTTGSWQHSEKAEMYSSKYGEYVTTGTIRNRHNNANGTGGEYGFPKGAQFDQDGIACQEFEGGYLSAQKGKGCEETPPEPTATVQPNEPEPTKIPDQR